RPWPPPPLRSPLRPAPGRIPGDLGDTAQFRCTQSRPRRGGGKSPRSAGGPYVCYDPSIPSRCFSCRMENLIHVCIRHAYIVTTLVVDSTPLLYINMRKAFRLILLSQPVEHQGRDRCRPELAVHALREFIDLSLLAWFSRARCLPLDRIAVQILLQ